MKRNFALVSLAFAVLAIVVYLATRPYKVSQTSGLPAVPSESKLPPGNTEGAGDGTARGQPSSSLFSQIIRSLEVECRDRRDRVRVMALAALLKKRVHEMAPDEAAASIAELLRSGRNYGTGLSFVVGPEGVMEEAPTLRTLLLDLLGQTDPSISAELSREILSTSDSADEYALAMRNLAWINHDGSLDGELLGWLRGMLVHPRWMTESSDGFLEAFDVAVHLGATREMADVLSITARDQSLAADRAAFMALDRIMLSDPQAIFGPALNDPSFFSASPMHRASLFSRLDVRDPRQQATLEEYILRFAHAPGEMEYFSRIFPNGNRFVGHRLVSTPEPVPSIDEMGALDDATVAVIKRWAEDPAFAARASELEAISARLESGRPSGQ